MKLHRILKGDETTAEVIEFSSGIVAVGWLREPFQVTIWTSLEHAINSHSLDTTSRFEEWEHKEIISGDSKPDTSGEEAPVARRPRKTRGASSQDGGGTRELS